MYRILNPKTGQLEYFEGEKPRKIPKAIPKISARKKARILESPETGSFLTIWNSRLHECEVCRRALFTPRAHNFDHEIPKSAGEEYRNALDNIRIKCFACHFKKTTGLNYKGPDLDLP